MTWAKLDDRMHSHAKVVEAGNEAVGLWVRLLAWCSEHATNGEFPACIARQFGDTDESLCARLVDVKLLDVADGGYEVHDFLDYNPSAKQVAMVRKRRALAGANGGSKRQANVKQLARGLLGGCLNNAQANVNPDPDPDPVPLREEREPRKRGPSARKGVKVERPADWSPSDRCRAIAQEYGLDLSLEVMDFLAWTDRGGYRFVDWDAAFRSHLVGAKKKLAERDQDRQARFELARHEQVKAEARKDGAGPDLAPRGHLPALPRPEAGPAVPPPPGLLQAIRGAVRGVDG